MSYLIDGYNLLHGAAVTAPPDVPYSLERARQALLDLLADRLSPAELARTMVVFDASQAPPGLPDRHVYRGIEVRFARRQESADALIEALIAADHSPRQLTVVSSDHRLHRAARRRRARAIDSEVWLAELPARAEHETTGTESAAADALKPHSASSDAETDYWLRQFSQPPPKQPPRAARSRLRRPPPSTDSG